MVSSYKSKVRFHSWQMNAGKAKAHVAKLEDAVGLRAFNDAKQWINFSVGVSNKFDFHRFVLTFALLTRSRRGCYRF